MPKILKEIPEVKLLIVGDGPDLQQLKRISKKLGLDKKIIFTGFVPYKEVPRFCSLADLCINPWRINEMTNKLSPVIIFDFLSCGQSTLATPLEGMLYDFPKTSNTIIYEDLELFTDKIIKLLRDTSLEQFGARSREFVAENFTWDIVTKKMLKELDDMIK